MDVRVTAARLTRSGHPEWVAPPVRIVHLGLGGFFRAHQAVYTAHAADAAQWGIAAFSGRSHALADRLAAQDGLYTLTVRGPQVDSTEVIPSVVAAHPGDDSAAWRSYCSAPTVQVVTLTVTEAAYGPGPVSVAPRLVDGLDGRRRADAGPITIVPCDNVIDNATVLGRLIVDEAERRGAHLADWVLDNVAMVGTMVDRITPRATDADVEAVARSGWIDAAPVVTEPFSEWVLSSPDGPVAGIDLPDWASAGAVFTDDLGPYTRRKLHLLNGAHSLLAYAGLMRGHTEVAEAIADPVLQELVDAWWDEAARTVGGPATELEDYRAALLERFSNPRLRHRLAQIAIDGSAKLPVRVVPVALAERRAGQDAPMAATIIGAWIAYARRMGGDLIDANRDEIVRTVRGPGVDVVTRSLALLDAGLAEDVAFVATVREQMRRFGAI